MVSLTLLRIWHYLAMVATVAILLILLQYYGRSWFLKQKVDRSNESR